jgi:hypothetical protein
MKFSFSCSILLAGMVFFFGNPLFAQYPPPASQPGTTAMAWDSSAFIGWATSCSVVRGYVNIADTNFIFNNSNKATYGIDYYGVGKANDSVVSLGDGGIATLTFDPPIVNGTGFDFAVFENSYSDTFLELAFVEVSSDGLHYARFPSVSLTPVQTQVGTFGIVDATKIDNLAGKYRAGFGTPFDLDSLKTDTTVDKNHITHVRLIDVVGCIQPAYATYDSKSNIINDPWPTPFWSAGFDLDAVGVIHHYPQSVGEIMQEPSFRIYPNPVCSRMTLMISNPSGVTLSIMDISGRIVLERGEISGSNVLDLSTFSQGMYMVQCTSPDGIVHVKRIIKL